MKSCLLKILITGSNGQIGTTLRLHPLAQEFQMVSCPRDMIDITNISSIEKGIDTYQPDLIINTAAFTAVDKAEQEIDLCMQVNYLGAKNLAMVAAKNNIPLIHLSTDYIFDGKKKLPYLENDQANPINIYGKYKWLGEEAIRNQCDQHIILRLSAVFSAVGNNFLKKILRSAREQPELKVAIDQVLCPTYAGDVANVIFKIIQQMNHWGTYHYSSATELSWHQFAEIIVKIAQKNLVVQRIIPIKTIELQLEAKRPPYSVLNCNKIKKDYGISQPVWENNLENIMASINQ